MTDYTTRDTCRLCGNQLPADRVVDFGNVPLANALLNFAPVPAYEDFRYPLYLVECGTCGHVQLPVVVDPASLFTHYRYVSGTSRGFSAHLHGLAVEVKRRAISSRVPLVELGSNDGTFLAACESEGIACIGVDPAQNLAVEASAAGQLTVPAFFGPKQAKALRTLLGRDAMVVGLNVFAHADDLSAIAYGAKELIGHSGSFVFEVAYLPDILMKNEIGTIYHEHVSHHHLRPLRRFFLDRGMLLYDAERVKVQGGSIRCWVARGDRRDQLAKETERMRTLLDTEQGLSERLKEWPARIAAEMDATRAELAPYRGQGLAIFGAPARLVTYAHALGLTQADVQCVFDDNPLKVGMRTPGQHWPIVASGELETRNPPAVLVSSWNYFAEIKARHPDYQGRWILPRRES